jgi:tripartite ATP-independent transporter DctM subunit
LRGVPVYLEDVLPLWMFGALLLFIFSGYPVAFALGGVALLFGALGIGLELFDYHFFFALPERIYGIMSNYVLLSIPFFIFMGSLLEKSGLAENLLRIMGMLFGPVRGGLAISVVVVGTLLAAATGVVGASVVAMGMISLPVMLRYGYSKGLAAGVITASGTLGQIIPPSVVLIVLGDQMGISVGDLFTAAFFPGLLLSGCFILYVAVIAFLKPEVAPAMPLSMHGRGLRLLLKDAALVMMPPLVLILFVLGGIFAGIATPTEAGALGSLGAMLLAYGKGTLSKELITRVLDDTVGLTVMVIFLLIGSTAFALVFRGLGGDIMVQDLLLDLPGGGFGLIFFSGLLIFFLGFFIDFFEIVFIVVPLLLPAVNALGIDPLWFAILISLNLQTSFLTPPFGFALFYLRGIAPPELKTTDIYRGVIPFILIQLSVLALVYIFPGIMKVWM